jgi:beta-lactamase regulating signal transducer with metallopeptidase domain/uncharacterized protein involved in exopolysaccharide biosynthesis
VIGPLDLPLASRIGWVLLHSLWQGAVVGGIFEAVRFVLRGRSANARYLVGCAALVVILAAAVVTFVVASPASPAASAPTVARADSFPLKMLSSGAGEAPRILEGNESSPLRAVAKILTGIAPWLAPLWIIGVVFFCFQLTRSWWWVGKIRRQENEPVHPDWLERLEALRRRIGISRPVRLLQSAWVEVPTVIGCFRPVILLPLSSITGLTPAQLEAVLAHELAHVRRLDCVVNAFQCFVETLLFYHPVVWWISGCVREERENCCDDLVVEVCGDRVVYAKALAALETSRSELPQLAFSATGGSLLNRIRRLLGASNASGPATARDFGGLALLGIGLLMIALGVCLPMSPRLYRSMTRIQVRDMTSQNLGNGAEFHATDFDPYFIQTEFEVIQSGVVLHPVIASLDLKSRWGKQYAAGRTFTEDEAIRLLKSRLNVVPVRNTSIIEIQAYDEAPDEAALIANTVAETYRKHRLQVAIDLMKSGVDALEKRKEESDKKIAQQQKVVDDLRASLGISDPDPEATTPPPALSPEVVKNLQNSEQYLVDIQVQLESQLSNLLKLDKSRQREALETALEKPDVQLANLENELNVAEKELSVLALDFSTNHPKYLEAEATIKNVNEKIDMRVEGILLGMENRIDATRARLAQLDERLKNARPPQGAADYYAAKKRLAEMISARQILEMKISSEETELTLPRTAQVVILDYAEPNFSAATFQRPTVPALVLIGLGVLFNLLGIQMLKRRPELPAVPAA